MPTVEEYSLFLNGILKTAQDKVWYVGLTTDDAIEEQLFVEHQVSNTHGFWIHRSLTTTSTAQ